MRYIIAFFVTLGLLFLLIFLLFHGGGKPKASLTTRTIDSYVASNAEVRMTIDGPINANQDHQQIQINANRDTVTFEMLTGYDGAVTQLQNYANTSNAYTNFLYALAHAGFMKGNPDPKSNDERGICPLGERYVFQLRQDDRDLSRYWATSCGGPKTYLGSLGLTITLFQAQVPNYTILTQNFRS